MNTNNTRKIRTKTAKFNQHILFSFLHFLISVYWKKMSTELGAGWGGVRLTETKRAVNNDSGCRDAQMKWAVWALGGASSLPLSAIRKVDSFSLFCYKNKSTSVRVTAPLDFPGLISNAPYRLYFRGLMWESMQSATQCSLSGWNSKSTLKTTDCPFGITWGSENNFSFTVRSQKFRMQVLTSIWMCLAVSVTIQAALVVFSRQ